MQNLTKFGAEDISYLTEGMTIKHRGVHRRHHAKCLKNLEVSGPKDGKDTTHTPSDFWDPVIQFAKLSLQPPQSMGYQKITVEQWKTCLKSKRKRAATGPDALARIDLIHMPDDI